MNEKKTRASLWITAVGVSTLTGKPIGTAQSCSSSTSGARDIRAWMEASHVDRAEVSLEREGREVSRYVENRAIVRRAA